MFEQHDLFWFMACVFCHIVDDFYLQGILADLKQKKFWQKHYPDRRYKNDYKAGLIIHSLSWSFLIQLPLWIRNWETGTYLWCFIASMLWLVNATMHIYVDHLKANKLKISFTVDQSIHLGQIVLSFIILAYLPL